VRILIAGCGDVGTTIGVALAADGHDVWGLRRDPANLPPVIRPLRADLTDVVSLSHLPLPLDVVVFTATPDGSTDAGYQRTYVDGLRGLLHVLGRSVPAPRRIVFASSTAVYGQTDGSWVDELSPTQPLDFQGRRLLEAESLLAASPMPATVVRLAGLYGPGRTRLVDRVLRGEAACMAGPPRYGNRIHRDDSAGVLRHIIELAEPAALYLAVDHEPAEECQVLRWLASRLGLPAPRVVPASAPNRRGNKRCRNARLVASGYRFRYPTFREGYAAVLQQLASQPSLSAASYRGGTDVPGRSSGE
jgi:nucleoside-diphosphate-sugar epimerase